MPIDTTTQQGRALQKAIAIRSARSSLRKGLKARTIDAYRLLAGDDPIWEETARGMKLETILPMMPGVGDATADDALAVLRLRGRLTLEGLSFELRAELAAVLRDAVEGPGLPTAGAVE